jgi:CBS domain containing-hemolysin-like protein
MGLLIIFFLLSIIFSFLCSVWEAVLLSITPSYANRKLQEGSPTGILLQEYKKDIDRPLSAILTLNTIAHTVGAIGVGAQAGKIFGDSSFDLGFVHLSFESVIATVMTLAILIASEIIPKTIGANNWKSLAPFTVKSLRFLIIALKPLVWVSEKITKTLKKDKDKSVLSRADFAAMVQVGEVSGAIEQDESTIIRNLMKLESLTVRDIMTPRTVMLLVNQDTKAKDFYKANPTLRFSRIPIYEEAQDHVVGMVLKDEILKQLVEGRNELQLKEIARPVVAVRDSLTLQELFKTLTEQRMHMVIVVDEYGSLVGLVTMEDLFETLLGMEILDESDADADLQALARKRWEERARKTGLIE